MAAKISRVPAKLLSDLLDGKRSEVTTKDFGVLLSTLNVSVNELCSEVERGHPSVLYMNRAEIHGSGRDVFRGGRHYYTYYSLPAPPNWVSPVLIDVLASPNEELIQNNGHLEPAITVNLGPGDIVGEWQRGTYTERRIIRANRNAESDWVSGDSYFEPPYFPHTYGLISHLPAQILSCTIRSDLDAFVKELNAWPFTSTEALLSRMSGKVTGGTLLGWELVRRGYSPSAIECAFELPKGSVEDFINGSVEALSFDNLQRIAVGIGVDYRILLDPIIREDNLCQTWTTVEETLKSVRSFRTYNVASVAASVRCSRACGFFMKVHNNDLSRELDLAFPTACHYLVNSGTVRLRFFENSLLQEFDMQKGDAVWVGPFVQHAFIGSGNLLRMDTGDGLSSRDYLNMTNTADLADTLVRAYQDLRSWNVTEMLSHNRQRTI